MTRDIQVLFVLMLLACPACSRRGGKEVPVPPPAPREAAALQAMRESDDLAFTAAYSQWLTSRAPEELPALRPLLAAGSAGADIPAGRGPLAMDWFDAHWAKADPRGFLEACARGEGHAFSLAAVKNALVDLLDKDPSAVRDLHPRVPLRGDLVINRDFMIIWANRDPRGALDHARQTHPMDDVFYSEFDIIYTVWAHYEPDAAWAGLMAEEDMRMRMRIAQSILGRALETDVKRAAGWMKQVARPADRRELIQAVFRSGARGRNPDHELEFARAMQAGDVWLGWAVNPPLGRITDEWLRVILREVPESEFEHVLRGLLAQNRDPGLRDRARGIFHSLPDGPRRSITMAVLLPGQSPPAADHAARPPAPSPAEIDAAFQDGRAALAYLAQRHDMNSSELILEGLKRHPAEAVGWVMENEPEGKNGIGADDLLAVLKPEEIGPVCLRVLAQPGRKHLPVAARLAAGWIRAAPVDALAVLGKLPTGQMRAVFSDRLDWYPVVSAPPDIKSACRGMLEALPDPLARSRALAGWERSENFHRRARPDPRRLTAMPPGSARESSMLGFVHAMAMEMERGTNKDHWNAVMALDRPDEARLRDAILARTAQKLFSSHDPTQAVEVVMAIQDDHVCLDVLRRVSSVSKDQEAEIRLLERIAAMPSGDARASVLRQRTREFIRLRPEELLGTIRATASLPVKRAFLESRLDHAPGAEDDDAILAEAESLPAVWQPPQLAAWRQAWRMRHDPAGVWREISAKDFHHGRTLRQAGSMWWEWMAADPAGARRALLSTHLPPEFHGPGIFDGQKKEDPSRTFDAILAWPGETSRHMTGLIDSWRREKPRDATLATLRLTHTNMRDFTMGNSWMEWMNRDPRAAMDWLANLPPGHDHRSLVSKLIHPSGQRTPAESLEILIQASDRDPGYVIDRNHSETFRQFEVARDAFLETRNQDRASLAVAAKWDAGSVRQGYDAMPEGPQKSNARLGLFSLAMEGDREELLAWVRDEISRHGSPGEQSEAAWFTLQAARQSPDADFPAVLAKLPWPEAAHVAACGYLRTGGNKAAADFPKMIANSADPSWRYLLAEAAGHDKLSEQLPEAAVLDRMESLAREILPRWQLAQSILNANPMDAIAAAMELPPDEARRILPRLVVHVAPDDREAAILRIQPRSKQGQLRAWWPAVQENPATEKEEHP